MPYTAVYKALALTVQNGVLVANVPQIFGETTITITEFTGATPVGREMGWVMFQGGNPEFPVWVSRSAAAGGGNGNGGGGVDEVWIGVDEPTGPQELWFDPDEQPVYPMFIIKGTLYGAATPLPVGPSNGDMYVLGTPVPTAAPNRPDVGTKAAGDVITWNGTAWLNIGPFQGAKGDKGDQGIAGVPQRQTLATIAASTYTLALTDEDKLLLFTSGLATTLTIPTNATVPFPLGARTDIASMGNGRVTVSPTGITLVATPTNVLRALGSGASLIKTALPDTWLMSGDMG